jgi:hypothetical protein
MPNPSLELLAWARINEHTEIQYAVCVGRMVELIIGGSDGLTIETTERGLENLLVAVSCALHALRSSAPAT